MDEVYFLFIPHQKPPRFVSEEEFEEMGHDQYHAVQLTLSDMAEAIGGQWYATIGTAHQLYEVKALLVGAINEHFARQKGFSSYKAWQEFQEDSADDMSDVV